MGRDPKAIEYLGEDSGLFKFVVNWTDKATGTA